MEPSRHWRRGLLLPTVRSALTFIAATGCSGPLDDGSEHRQPPTLTGSWTIDPTEMHPIPPADTTSAVCVQTTVSVDLAPVEQQAGKYVFGGSHASLMMVCSGKTQSARAVLGTADSVVHAAAGAISGNVLWIGSYCVFSCTSPGTPFWSGNMNFGTSGFAFAFQVPEGDPVPAELHGSFRFSTSEGGNRVWGGAVARRR